MAFHSSMPAHLISWLKHNRHRFNLTRHRHGHAPRSVAAADSASATIRFGKTTSRCIRYDHCVPVMFDSAKTVSSHPVSCVMSVGAAELSSPVYAGVHRCICLLSRVHGRHWLQTRVSSFVSHHTQMNAQFATTWRGSAAVLLVQGCLLCKCSDAAPSAPAAISPTRSRPPLQLSPVASMRAATAFQSALSAATPTVQSNLSDSVVFRTITVGLRHASPMVRGRLTRSRLVVLLCFVTTAYFVFAM